MIFDENFSGGIIYTDDKRTWFCWHKKGSFGEQIAAEDKDKLKVLVVEHEKIKS